MRVLVVGAGGIGCELLKNLVLLPLIEEIWIVDMDRIALSNLNRQFLFHKEHLGQMKSTVAMTTLQTLYLRKLQENQKVVLVKAFQGDITNRTLFPWHWWLQVDVVMNALDNIDARRYVNQMVCTLKHDMLESEGELEKEGQNKKKESLNHPSKCMFLIESGTEGYQGQVSVICRNIFECFECAPSPALTNQSESYPICTIKSTPNKLVHCVVWAKDILFQEIFCTESKPRTAENNAVNMELNEIEHAGTEEVAALDVIEKAQKSMADNSDKFFDYFRTDLLSSSSDKNKLFERLLTRCFFREMITLRSLKDLWLQSNPPFVLPLSVIPFVDIDARQDEGTQEIVPTITEKDEVYLTVTNQVISLIDTLRVNFLSLCDCRHSSTDADQNILSFDKDDDKIMGFVYSAACLRALLFNIPTQTLFDVKGK